MKTYTVLEPSDIDMKDPLNSMVAVIFLLETFRVFDPTVRERIKNEPERVNQEIVASFRNGFAKAGYSIVKIEEVPKVFHEENDGSSAQL